MLILKLTNKLLGLIVVAEFLYQLFYDINFYLFATLLYK
jgi:hypothetical protein